MEISHSEAGSLRSLTLGDKDVHIWRASLRQSPAIVQQLRQTLSKDEAVRAARFHFPHDREAFIIARSILKSLLAGYLSVELHQLTFGYQQAGKPFLSGDLANQIFFNVSHSHEMALYALSHQPNTGIDIEYIRPIIDMEQIAMNNFSVNENAQLQLLPPHMVMEGFFNCWTRKEAYVKAIGSGISHPLQDFDVSLMPGEPVRLLSISGSQSEAARWTLSDLKPSAGYAAAVVVEGSGYSILQHEWISLSALQICRNQNDSQGIKAVFRAWACPSSQ